MKKPTKIATVALTVTALAAGGFALADRSDGERGSRMLDRVSEKLELDDNQRVALDTLFTEVAEMRQLAKGNGDDLRGQLTTLVTADTFDQGTALEMINSRAAAIQNSAPELVVAAAVFLDGLSAEQKAAIAEFAEKHRGHRRH